MIFPIILVGALALSSSRVAAIAGGFNAITLGNWQGVGVVMIDNGPWHYHQDDCIQFCTGVMVDYQLVLTNSACHCPQVRKPYSTVVYMGNTFNAFEDFDTYWVVNYLEVHPGINPHYELILLKLDRPMADLKDGMFYTIPGEHDKGFNLTEQDYMVFGFGTRDWEKPIPVLDGMPWRYDVHPMLQAISVRETLHWQQLDICRKFLSDIGTKDREFICLGRRDEPTVRLTYADNGAPAVGRSDRVLYGIACAKTDTMRKPFYKPEDSFPTYFIDVKSEQKAIIKAMIMLKYRSNV